MNVLYLPSAPAQSAESKNEPHKVENSKTHAPDIPEKELHLAEMSSRTRERTDFKLSSVIVTCWVYTTNQTTRVH